MDLLYQERPSLRLALDEEEETLIKDLMAWQQEQVAMKWINGSEVLNIESRLSPNIRGAVYEEQSAQLDSYRLTLALGQAAEAKGARLHAREVIGLVIDGSTVTGVRTASGEYSAGTVVLAAGVWSAPFGESINFPVPVRALKGERLMLRFAGEPLPVLISSPKRGHMISRRDGFMSIGSTGGRDYDRDELFLGEGFDRQPTEKARVELLQRGIDVFPALQDAELVQQLAGSRPLSPDRFPIIGPVPGWEGIVLATGHGTKGVHLGPITGRTVADYILGGKGQVPELMQAFLPGRFSQVADEEYYSSSQRVDE
jgi:glycine oxidase